MPYHNHVRTLSEFFKYSMYDNMNYVMVDEKLCERFVNTIMFHYLQHVKS
uniref:Uncharacterized protein n=1 Tax=viral metagenome TaxID=1070528 RepID=A0A6C0CKA1_9ZZZZ